MSEQHQQGAHTIESQADFEKTKRGWAERWAAEMEAASGWLEKWHESAQVCLDAFHDRQQRTKDESHLTFYWAGVVTLRSLLFGRTPSVDVTRRFGDADDDKARIGATMLQRLLNTDIERYDDGFQTGLQNVLSDFLIVGFGNARLRYWAEFETVPESADPVTSEVIPAHHRKTSEDVCTDYVFWKDQRWSPARTYSELRWWAFKVPMTRDDLHRRFDASAGKDAVASVPMTDLAHGTEGVRNDEDQTIEHDAWKRAAVWEIWDKETRQVFWWVKGMDEILDVQPDPLQLQGFFPFPRPLFANLTTDALIGQPDYALVQDLYDDINLLATRVRHLEDALRVAGVYDVSAGAEIEKLLNPAVSNQLIPVPSLSAIAEKGGLQNVIDWLPLEQVVIALEKTQIALASKRQLLFELTGWQDNQRAERPSQTATEVRAEVRFGSVRVQALQDEFARYAAEFQQLRAEIIARLFDPETIKKRSNITLTPDRDQADLAVQQLKSEFPSYRIDVKPEALAQADFAALKNERVEFLGAFSQLMRDVAPVIQQLPDAGPVLIEVIKWALAGFKGAATIEGTLDRALAQARRALQQPRPAPPDPKLQQQAQKTQADLQIIEAKKRADMEKDRMSIETERMRQEMQFRYNVAEEAARTRLKQSLQREKTAADTARARMPNVRKKGEPFGDRR
jgi:hypothetical protein